MTERKTIQVVAALIYDPSTEKIMICQRPENKDRGLLWEFPGGKVEKGESKEQALIRECLEELSVEILPKEIYASLVHDYPDIKIELTLFKAVIVSGEPKKLEHNDIKWVYPCEASKYDFCPADKEILERLKRENIK